MLNYITTFSLKLKYILQLWEHQPRNRRILCRVLSWLTYIFHPWWRSPSSHSPIICQLSHPAILPQAPYSETWTLVFVPKTLLALCFRFICLKTTVPFHLKRLGLTNIVILSSWRPLVILISFSIFHSFNTHLRAPSSRATDEHNLATGSCCSQLLEPRKPTQLCHTSDCCGLCGNQLLVVFTLFQDVSFESDTK